MDDSVWRRAISERKPQPRLCCVGHWPFQQNILPTFLPQQILKHFHFHARTAFANAYKHIYSYMHNTNNDEPHVKNENENENFVGVNTYYLSFIFVYCCVNFCDHMLWHMCDKKKWTIAIYSTSLCIHISNHRYTCASRRVSLTFSVWQRIDHGRIFEY